MKYLLFVFMFYSFVQAQVTMCYKNNHSNPATIEQEFLDGGKCEGKKSLNQMKKELWKVDDIKIFVDNKGTNYIYILKKDDDSEKKVDTQNIDYKTISKNLLEEKQKEENIKKIESGKNFYKKVCERCHGIKGELKAKNTSRRINSLTLAQFKKSISGYQWNEYNNGKAFLMKPYANLMTNEDMEMVYEYLKTINSN